jgi:hypothetical protein
MPDAPDSVGIVSLVDLKRLAELFDVAENALEPDSAEADEAQIAFDKAVRQLFECKVASNPAFAAIPQPVFKSKLRSLCRQYLRKN